MGMMPGTIGTILNGTRMGLHVFLSTQASCFHHGSGLLGRLVGKSAHGCGNRPTRGGCSTSIRTCRLLPARRRRGRPLATAFFASGQAARSLGVSTWVGCPSARIDAIPARLPIVHAESWDCRISMVGESLLAGWCLCRSQELLASGPPRSSHLSGHDRAGVRIAVPPDASPQQRVRHHW
jgi:hypothetical protein